MPVFQLVQLQVVLAQLLGVIAELRVMLFNLLKFTDLDNRMSLLTKSVFESASDLLPFLFLFLIFILVFGCVGYLLYGPLLYEWSTIGNSVVTAIDLFNGNYGFQGLEAAVDRDAVIDYAVAADTVFDGYDFWGGVEELWRRDAWLLAAVAGASSGIWPFAKNMLTVATCWAPGDAAEKSRRFRLLGLGGKTAILDIAFIALLVTASCGRDDFREIWGGETMRNRHRHAW